LVSEQIFKDDVNGVFSTWDICYMYAYFRSKSDTIRKLQLSVPLSTGCLQYSTVKGSVQRKKRGVGKIAVVSNEYVALAVDLGSVLNFAVVFLSTYFLFLFVGRWGGRREMERGGDWNSGESGDREIKKCTVEWYLGYTVDTVSLRQYIDGTINSASVGDVAEFAAWLITISYFADFVWIIRAP
jgi:hypothetical protein